MWVELEGTHWAPEGSGSLKSECHPKKPMIPSPKELPAAGRRGLLSPSLDSVHHTEAQAGQGQVGLPDLPEPIPPRPKAGPGLDSRAQSCQGPPDESLNKAPRKSPQSPSDSAPRAGPCLSLRLGSWLPPPLSLGCGSLVFWLSLFSDPPAPERIHYVPQLSSATLAGTLTQSTFTLEQPRGQFSRLNISDFDPIWLVVAHSNGGCPGGGPWFSLGEMDGALEEQQGWREWRRCCRGCGQGLPGPVGWAGALPMWPPCHMGPGEQVKH